MPKVMIGPPHVARSRGEFLSILERAGFEIVYPAKLVQMTESDVLAQLPGIPAALAGSEPYTRAVFEHCPQLRVVARAGVGYDAVDVAAATEHGVVVTIAPGANHEAVAEHALLLMLALAKRLLFQHREILAGHWPRHPYLPLRQKTLSIIGLGRTGKAVATRAKAFGMNVLACELAPDTGFIQQHGIKLVSLDDALASADFLSLHVPLTVQTRQMINAQTIAKMKPGAFLVNTARGPVVHEADLAEALGSGRLAGAGIDVFDVEPPRPDNPLLKCENVILSAHTAGVDVQSRDEMAQMAAQCIARIARGDWPAECVVNPEVRAKFKGLD